MSGRAVGARHLLRVAGVHARPAVAIAIQFQGGELMYILSTGACSLPNSATPMSQEAIDAQDAYIAAVGADFDGGNATLDNIIQKLGGNPIGATYGNAGVATSGDPASLDDPTASIAPASVLSSPGAASSSPAGSSALSPGANGRLERMRRINRRNSALFGGGPQGGGTPGGVPEALAAAARAAASARAGCPAPQVLPLVTVFPIPAVAPASPAPTAIAPGPAPAAAPAAATAPASRPIPSTGNVCADLVLGLVTKDQVTVAQEAYCSANGYQGARFPPTWVQQEQISESVAGTLPKVPYQTPPPNTDPSGLPAQYANFIAGLGDAEAAGSTQDITGLSSPLFWVTVAAAAAAMWYFSKGHARE